MTRYSSKSSGSHKAESSMLALPQITGHMLSMASSAAMGRHARGASCVGAQSGHSTDRGRGRRGSGWRLHNQHHVRSPCHLLPRGPLPQLARQGGASPFPLHQGKFPGVFLPCSLSRATGRFVAIQEKLAHMPWAQLHVHSASDGESSLFPIASASWLEVSYVYSVNHALLSCSYALSIFTAEKMLQ